MIILAGTQTKIKRKKFILKDWANMKKTRSSKNPLQKNNKFRILKKILRICSKFHCKTKKVKKYSVGLILKIHRCKIVRNLSR